MVATMKKSKKLKLLAAAFMLAALTPAPASASGFPGLRSPFTSLQLDVGTAAPIVVPPQDPSPEIAGAPIAAAPEQAGGGGEGGLGAMSADEIARQSSNPLGGAFWILLNQFDNYYMRGDLVGNRTLWLNTWSFQPVVPIPIKSLGDDWILVNRPTVPVVLHANVPTGYNLPPGGGAPVPPPGPIPAMVNFESFWGLGDMVHFSMLGRSIKQQQWGGGDLVLALGPTFQFPTATEDELGNKAWSAGPAGVAAFIGRKFILGALGQHWWDFAGTGSDSQDVNYTWVNFFYFLNFPGGWQVGGTPVWTADWEANKDNRWTLPIGVGVYKTHFFFGKMPIKLGVELQYSMLRPEALGQEWNARFVFAPVIPALQSLIGKN